MRRQKFARARMERLLNFRNEKLYFLWWKQENGGGERVNDVEEGRQAGFLVSNAELDSRGTDEAPNRNQPWFNKTKVLYFIPTRTRGSCTDGPN